MLTVFNRTEIFITYTRENMKNVCKIFDIHGIEYTVKTTKVEDANTDEEILDDDKQSFDLTTSYKVYVQKKNADEAQKLVHEALFPHK